jgi:hypothetical protein
MNPKALPLGWVILPLCGVYRLIFFNSTSKKYLTDLTALRRSKLSKGSNLSKCQKYHNVKISLFFSSIFGTKKGFVREKRKDLRVVKIQKDRIEAPPTSPREG